MRGKWILISAGILAGLLLAGILVWWILAPPPRHAVQPPPVLRFSVEGRMVTFDPHLHDEAATWTTLCNLYEGMVRFDPNLRVEPALAQAWSNPDATRWLFQLRPGVRFHDGRVLEADDVVYSLRRAAFFERSVIRPYLTSILAVSTPEAGQVQIETRQPDPLLLNKLTFVFIVPRADSFESAALANRPIGTGPYRLDHWTTESNFLLQRFDGYWGRRGGFPRVEVSHIHEEVDRVDALLAGKIDLTRGLQAEDHRRVQASRDYRSKVSDSLTVMLLALNTTQLFDGSGNPLTHKLVRQAIHLALDRDRLVEKGFGGLARPAHQLVPPDVFGFDRGLPATTRDLSRARGLLASAGYADGFPLSISVSSTSRKLGEAIRDDLAGLGIRVRLHVMLWDELYRRLTSDTPPQAMVFGWACTSGDASDFLDTCLHSRTRDGSARMGELNSTAWADPELDRLIEESRHTMRVQDRLELLGQISRIALEELPYVPLTIDPEIYGYRDGLSWPSRVDARIYLNEVTWQSTD